jgi:hypothetical protein
MSAADSVSSAAAWAVVVAAFVAGLVGSGVAGLFQLRASRDARREDRVDRARDRRIQDLRELQDALEVQASFLGRFYIERGKSDVSDSPSEEVERIVHAFTEGNMRIHKLRARIRDEIIDDSVRDMMAAQGELARRDTTRSRQKEVLYGDLDGLLTGMQQRLGELLAVEDRAVTD